MFMFPFPSYSHTYDIGLDFLTFGTTDSMDYVELIHMFNMFITAIHCYSPRYSSLSLFIELSSKKK